MNSQTHLQTVVKTALTEDLGSGDVSADLLNNNLVSANIIVRQSAIICGIDYFNSAFLQLDATIKIDWQVLDGDCVVENQILCSLSGPSQAIISAERVALNFLQMLSAVATQTKYLVDKIAHTNAQLLDTRKTIPGLRMAQKYAVQCGGGVNHRMGLYDCVMLKENHIIAAASIANAVQTATQKYPNLPLIVEVQNLGQLKQALNMNHITRILCDNFCTQDLLSAVDLAHDRLPLEASGNINQHNIVEVADTGIDYISTGSITKNIQAIDLSLIFV